MACGVDRPDRDGVARGDVGCSAGRDVAQWQSGRVEERKVRAAVPFAVAASNVSPAVLLPTKELLAAGDSTTVPAPTFSTMALAEPPVICLLKVQESLVAGAFSCRSVVLLALTATALLKAVALVSSSVPWVSVVAPV